MNLTSSATIPVIATSPLPDRPIRKDVVRRGRHHSTTVPLEQLLVLGACVDGSVLITGETHASRIEQCANALAYLVAGFVHRLIHDVFDAFKPLALQEISESHVEAHILIVHGFDGHWVPQNAWCFEHASWQHGSHLASWFVDLDASHASEADDPYVACASFEELGDLLAKGKLVLTWACVLDSDSSYRSPGRTSLTV